MEIRTLQAEDRAGFRAIMRGFYGHAGNVVPGNEEIDRLFDIALAPDRNLVFIVASVPGGLAGIVSLTFGESSYKVSPFAWCDDLYVDPAHRRTGLGTRLLEEAVRVAAERNCSNILLGVGEDEADARRFYEANGYRDMSCRLLTRPLE